MWFRLAGADWSGDGNSLGSMNTISGSWTVQCATSGGISKTAGAGFVTQGGTWTGTFTLATGATLTGTTLTPSSAGTVTSSTSGSTVTITIANVSANCTLSVVATGGSSSGGGKNYTITYKYISGTIELQAATTETVAAGTFMAFSIDSAPTIDGYICSSVSPTSATITSDITVTYMYDAEAATTATLTVNPTPSDAKVTLYAKGYSASGNSITVSNDGTVSPLYQVYKDNYLSQGGTVAKIKSSQTLNITLQPFSAGNWTDISSTAEKVADYFVVDASGKFNGPHPNWCHWIIPATPGKKYRITATAGQNARLWGFYTDKPVSDGSVKPISVSSNSSMTVKIADEAVAPEGTVYLVVNNRIGSGDTKAIIEVLD